MKENGRLCAALRQKNKLSYIYIYLSLYYQYYCFFLKSAHDTLFILCTLFAALRAAQSSPVNFKKCNTSSLRKTRSNNSIDRNNRNTHLKSVTCDTNYRYYYLSIPSRPPPFLTQKSRNCSQKCPPCTPPAEPPKSSKNTQKRYYGIFSTFFPFFVPFYRPFL